MSFLSTDQFDHFRQCGYLVVPGIVPEDIAASAEEAVWRVLGKQPDDPSTWHPHPPHSENFDDPALLATYTPEVLAVVEELAAIGRNQELHDGAYSQPTSGHCLNRFPQNDHSEWPQPAPHVDHSIPADGHRTFPRAYRMAAMTYLTDCVPQGGNTVVWPDAYHRLWDEAESDPVTYETMATFGKRVKEIDIGEMVELVPSRGDVIFYDVMCAHSGSANISDRPRFALNWKW
jgi:ectoine hydroxylase-related dioxygenase (phytanoyl-CoA dioxygenase family)